MSDDLIREAIADRDRGSLDVEADLDATRGRARRRRARRQRAALAGAAVSVATVITATVVLVGDPGDLGVSTGSVASNGGTNPVPVTSATDAVEPVVVPDVVGLSEPHAKEVLESAGFGVEVQVAGESSEVPWAYEVSAQRPAAGSAAAAGDVVTLIVPVPDREASDRSAWVEVETEALHAERSLPYENTVWWVWDDRDGLWRPLYQHVDLVTQGTPVAVADGIYRSQISVHVPPKAGERIASFDRDRLAVTPAAGPPTACTPGDCAGQPSFVPPIP